MSGFTIFIIVMNVVVFLTYGLDKYFARHRMMRIPSIVLLIIPFFFAGVGAFLGMRIFNHKTRFVEFNMIVPLSIIFDAVLYLLVTNLS